MNGQLKLESIRSVLVRLEETILFSLIERAQFRQNRVIYQPGAFGPALGGECLVDFLLHETERTHAKMRRYTSPDEHAFFDDLPAPLLPALTFGESPLVPNQLNINQSIREIYFDRIVGALCEAGDDMQYGSSAVNDVACLQSISRRVHYGKFVAESKYMADPGRFQSLIRDRDRVGLMTRITDEAVERAVLDRVRGKAQTYGQVLRDSAASGLVDPAVIVDIYAKWIIPLNKEVQVAYLLVRNEGA